LAQLPNITNSVLRFRNQLLPIGNGPVLIAAVGLSQLVPEFTDQILESPNFLILFALDMLKFGSQRTLYGLLVNDGTPQLFDLPLELLLQVSVLPLYVLYFQIQAGF
jgi:hypothetical protein